MRLRVRLKSLVLLAVLSCCALVYNLVGQPLGNFQVDDGARVPRVARITAGDLMALGRFSDPAPAPSTVQSIGRNAVGSQMLTNTSDIRILDVAPHKNFNILSAPPPVGGVLRSQPPLVGPITRPERGELTNHKNPSLRGSEKPCDGNCQFRRLRQESLAALAKIRSQRQNQTRDAYMRVNPCDQACRLAKLKRYGINRGGYSSRVQVENVTLPDSWTVTRELVDRLSSRRSHIHEVCKKYGLDKPSKSYKPNAWEFLVNEKYNLVWCNVFKAASSTWFYNFNLLAGYTEQELLHAKETPIQMARKRYPRPKVEELEKAMHADPQPLSFMIARHPLQRLVSGFRDKILSGNRYYSKLSRTIVRQYKHLAPKEETDSRKTWSLFGKTTPKSIIPSFPQFVQFLLDESDKGKKLDEHWTPMTDFCTPCLVDFDVFAKVETMEEDGNYIIFSAGIQDVIKPKRINRSRNEPTDAVAEKFLCSLTEEQMDGLLKLYRYDIELFSYDVSNYVNCTRS